MESMSPTPSIGHQRRPYLALLMAAPSERDALYGAWWEAHDRATQHLANSRYTGHCCRLDLCAEGQALWDEAERLESELPHRKKTEAPGHGPTASAGERTSDG